MIKNVEVLEGFPDWPHNFIDLSLFDVKSQQLFRDASSYSEIDFLVNAFSFHVMYHPS